MNKFNFDELKKHMKGMSFREGFDYLWEYYRLPFFVTVFCLICLISLVSGIIRGNLSNPVLRVAVSEQMDLYHGGEIEQLLKETFPDASGFTAPEKVSVSSLTDASNPYGPVQLVAYLSSGSLDALLCDQDTLDYMKENEISLSSRDITDTSLGRKAAELDYSSFYYVILNDSENAEAASRFLSAIISQQ